ncbi:hypothetical protein O77CONTIG1_01894 [Leptolyngbya sp. O-77]|nr:hypothetical protein O77CONTIG1_01894 [Leptolyngbya sp. O-77]
MTQTVMQIVTQIAKPNCKAELRQAQRKATQVGLHRLKHTVGSQTQRHRCSKLNLLPRLNHICEVWHFLPAVRTKPVDTIVSRMAQQRLGAARAKVHGFIRSA